MNHALGAGTVIGGHTIRHCLGRGGFGITYLAENNRSKRLHALKEYFPTDFALRNRANTIEALPERVGEFETGRQLFYNEAKNLRDLPREPGLVKVNSAFERNGTVYCVMEYIEGEPLEKLISRYVQQRRIVPEDLVVDFIRRMTSALRVLHDHGLIHRDIKPANVMIRRSDNRPVLIDFGASRQVGDAASLASARGEAKCDGRGDDDAVALLIAGICFQIMDIREFTKHSAISLKRMSQR